MSKRCNMRVNNLTIYRSVYVERLGKRAANLRHLYTSFGGVRTVAAGAAGEIANVSHTFHPSGRFDASNSLYPLRFKYPCISPTGNKYPICGPMPETRDSKGPKIGN